jgi:DNA-binding CsgD family transcriptional regulator
MGVQELLGRDAQLEVIGTWLGDPARLPSTRLLEGEAGIGKTSLVRAAMADAERRGYAILEASPVEPESRLAYAALGDLLTGSLDTILPALAEPQRVALEAALLLRPAPGHPPEALAVATAFLNGVRALATASPVLVAIDDAQWLDAATTEVVRFALRRLRVEHVAIVLSRRTSSDPGAGLDTAGLPSPASIEVGPLSIGAIHALVRERTGVVLARPLLRRLHELSGGNPFYAIELARAIGEGRLRLEPGEALPRDLRELVDARVAGLPADTRAALAACAAMSRPTEQLLAEVLGTDDPARALAPAVASGVVDPPDGTIAFTHPLLATGAYAALGPGERRKLHERLARTVPDSLERARHLALAANGPDEAVAVVVEQAAVETFARAASADAADLVALARRLTPASEDEALRRRTYFEAYYRFESGEAEVASALLGGLIERTDPGPERARLLAALARVTHFHTSVGDGVALKRRALAEVGSDAELRVCIEEGIAEDLLLMRTDLDAACAHARSAASLAEECGDRATLAEALAAVALTERSTGRPSTDAMDRALELEPATLHLCVMRHPSFAFGSVLSWEDRLEHARDVFLDLMRRADDRGNVTSIAPIRNRLSTVRCLLGDLAEAERLARESSEFALQNGQLPSRASALGRLALVLARRGDVEEARATAQRSLALAGGSDFAPERPAVALGRGGEHALWAMGELALSVGDPVETHRYLGPLATAFSEAGVREPGELRFLLAEVEALVLLGRLMEADRRASWLEAEADRVGRPSPTSAASAARGLVRAAEGDLRTALDDLERAVLAARQAPLPFELGRALLLLGRVQRRATLKRAARGSLEEALTVFERLGARRWAEVTRDELGRIGGRAPAHGTLSETERQVASLVTRGLSNKEVAAALFVTPKAVEANLSRVFAKTGVHSRTELAALMASEAGSALVTSIGRTPLSVQALEVAKQ